MKLIILSLIILIPLFSSGCSSTTTTPTSIPPANGYQPIADSLSAAITHQVALGRAPAFSIALVDGDRIVWAKGFGHQDHEKKIPATAATIYRVGSVSKLFTDLAVMQRAEHNQLSLDTPVSQYLPNFKPANQYNTPITLRHLMSHQSGLVRESPVGNYFDPTSPSIQKTVESLNNIPLVYPPGTRTKYSNAGIAVVGHVLETQTKTPFSKAIDNAVLSPLHMHSSSFDLTPQIQKHLADAYMWTYDDRRFLAPKFPLGTSPAGNLYSNVIDLSKFIIAIHNDGLSPNGPIISPQTMKQMLTPIDPKDPEAPPLFGIGFRVSDFDGHKKIGHGGAVYGFSTQFEVLPDRKLGVIAVSSLDGSNGMVSQIANHALRLMLAKQKGQPLPKLTLTQPVNPDKTRPLAGLFKSDTQTIRLEARDNRLFLWRGSYRKEVRAQNNNLIVDDPLGFGPSIRVISNDALVIDGTRFNRIPDTVPADIPTQWKDLIGEYGWDHNTLYILEDHGKLYALIEWFYYYPLTQINENEFAFPPYGLYHGEKLIFNRDKTGRPTSVTAAQVKFDRRAIGQKDGETFKIKPIRPINQLRASALAASPPNETGDFRKTDLVELDKLDPTILLDIRYASTNNFTGAVFYKQPRAFMQRTAALAVVAANKALKKHGLGLIVYDAYRPWHVTKMFWDATPNDLKDFVADPSKGSRHNRGAAVDLTFYDLKTKKPIHMAAGYDEFSHRSYPAYPGETSRKRWYRTLLRKTMEDHGFTIYEYEWWHFDHKDWRKYRIGNQTFEAILKQK